MDNLDSSLSKNIDEVNLKEIYEVLVDSKRFLILVTSLITFTGIIYSLWAPKMWTSSALLTIADSSNSSFSNNSAMGGLASLANLGGMNESSLKGSKVVATARSREFFNHLLTFEDVLPNLVATKGFNTSNGITIYDGSKYDSSKKSWVQGSKPPNWIAFKKYKKVLTIRLDQKSNFVTISIEHRSPEFAKSFLELIIQELNALSRDRALRQSQASLDYLYEELQSFQLNDVRLAISQLIETQLKTQMLARVKIDYALESLDKPFLPKERTSPKRTQITIFSFIVGLLFSTFFILIRYFLTKNFK